MPGVDTGRGSQRGRTVMSIQCIEGRNYDPSCENPANIGESIRVTSGCLRVRVALQETCTKYPETNISTGYVDTTRACTDYK